MITGFGLLVIYLVASVVADRVAVIFTDIKLDDKVAIHILGQSNDYDTLIAVINGVLDHDAAHGDLVNFLYAMNAPLVDQQIIVLSGNQKRSAANHETLFLGQKTPCHDNFTSSIDKMITPNSVVDIFHIAPTPKDYINKMAAITTIGTYHMVLNYYSKNDKDDDNYDEYSIEWLQSIKPTILKHSPSATIIFTVNFASVNPEDTGSSQPYSILSTVLPQAHLDASLNNALYFDTFDDCVKALYYANASLKTPLLPKGFENANLHELLLRARINNVGDSEASNLRLHFIAYLNEAFVHLDGIIDYKTLNSLVTNGKSIFETMLMVDMCEANHVVAVRSAIKHHQITPITFSTNTLAKIKPASETDNDGMTIADVSSKTILNDLLDALSPKTVYNNEAIHVGTAICGEDARSKFLDCLLSILFYGIENFNDVVHIHVFTDDTRAMKQTLISDVELPPNIKVIVYGIDVENPKYHLFRYCASIRLYFHELFEFDLIPQRLIYLDADTIVTAPLKSLLESTNRNDDQVLISIAEEGGSTYSSAMPLYYENNVSMMQYPNGTSGFNSGVLVMELHRMLTKFSYLRDYHLQLASLHPEINLRYGDQCLLNLIAARYPQYFAILPCNWNYRTDTFVECKDAYTRHGGVLHGNRNSYQNDDIFKRLYQHHMNVGYERYLKRLNHLDEIPSEVIWSY